MAHAVWGPSAPPCAAVLWPELCGVSVYRPGGVPGWCGLRDGGIFIVVFVDLRQSSSVIFVIVIIIIIVRREEEKERK